MWSSWNKKETRVDSRFKKQTMQSMHIQCVFIVSTDNPISNNDYFSAIQSQCIIYFSVTCFKKDVVQRDGSKI